MKDIKVKIVILAIVLAWVGIGSYLFGANFHSDVWFALLLLETALTIMVAGIYTVFVINFFFKKFGDEAGLFLTIVAIVATIILPALILKLF